MVSTLKNSALVIVEILGFKIYAFGSVFACAWAHKQNANVTQTKPLILIKLHPFNKFINFFVIGVLVKIINAAELIILSTLLLDTFSFKS